MRWRLLATLALVANAACQSDGPRPEAPGGSSGTGAAGSGTTGAGGADSSGTGNPGGGIGAVGGSGNGTTGGSGSGAGGDAGEPATFEYNGALSFAVAGVVTGHRVQISAPILPRTTVIYAPFPTSLDGEKTMAHDASLLFDWLLPPCAQLYPTITLAPADGTPLTQTQLATNYDQIGLCAYMQYVAKPYWIPRLVDDVDICGTEMGPGWRLITEADLASLTEADFQKVANTWALLAPGGTGLSFFYTSLAIWVRADDGSIQSGTLAPGITGSHMIPLPPGVSTSMSHYEGALGLRCIRRTDAP